MQDLLRFALALSVVLFHYQHFAIQSALSPPPYDFAPPYNDTLSIFYTHGYHAVAVFFFLSGYMLASPLHAQTNPQFSYRNFLIKRLARIYPAHAITLLLMSLLAIVVNKLSLQPFMTYNDNLENFFASILLLNGTGLMRDTSFNLPAWSLSVEFICYLIFAGICALSIKQRTKYFFVGLLFGVAIKEIFSDPNVSNVGSGMVFFFAGTITAVKFKPWCDRFLPNGCIAIPILLGVCGLSFLLSLHTSLGLQKLIWVSLSLPTLVIALTAIDQILDQRKNRPFIWFGLISFSIYIWHFPIQAVLHHLFSDYTIDDVPLYNTQLLFWSYLAASILVSHISLSTIEKWGSAMILSRKRSNC